MAKVQYQEEFVPSGKAWGMMAVIVAGVAVFSVFAVLLPHERYIRFQQFDHSDLFKLRWDYERLHFDSTPIDVAIIGSSRVEAALSGPELAASLSKKVGRPIHVANIAIPYEGRNLHYEIARDLLATHPEVKLILLSVEERADVSHPAFRYVSDVSEVLNAPLWISHSYAVDAAFLPYRQMSYFIQSQFPAWFSVSRTPRSDYLGTGWDSTQSFQIPGGRRIDRYLVANPEKLAAEAQDLKGQIGYGDGNWVRPSAWYTLNEPLEPQYTERLVAMAKARGAQPIFIHMPFYNSVPGQFDHGFYEKLAPLLDAQQFCNDPHDYADAAHFNRYGIAKISPWLDSSLDPYLGLLRSGSGAQR
jgi:hypothetical protein